MIGGGGGPLRDIGGGPPPDIDGGPPRDIIIGEVVVASSKDVLTCRSA